MPKHHTCMIPTALPIYMTIKKNNQILKWCKSIVQNRQVTWTIAIWIISNARHIIPLAPTNMIVNVGLYTSLKQSRSLINDSWNWTYKFVDRWYWAYILELLNCFMSAYKWWSLMNCFNNCKRLRLLLVRFFIDFRMRFKFLAIEIAQRRNENAKDKNDPK